MKSALYYATLHITARSTKFSSVVKVSLNVGTDFGARDDTCVTYLDAEVLTMYPL